jgi:hypothetical protein
MSTEEVAPDAETVVKEATLSDDGVYRYTLGRTWDPELPPMVFVMLNPSTADASEDDPTIRRCMSFARREGAGGLQVVNLYAYRTADPKVLWQAEAGGVNIVGPDNDMHLEWFFRYAEREDATVVAAWGAGAKQDRANEVVALATQILGAGRLVALSETKGGMPGHPLYQKGDRELTAYRTDVADNADMEQRIRVELERQQDEEELYVGDFSRTDWVVDGHLDVAALARAIAR